MTTETPSLDQPRLCVDCAHYIKQNRDYPQARCGFRVLGISVVDGSRIFETCIGARANDLKCGPVAKQWTKRTDKLPF